MDDIYEPLDLYRDQLKAAFRTKAEETFAQMEAKAGIDAAANKKLCADIDHTIREIESYNSKLFAVKTLMVLMILIGVALFVPLFFLDEISVYWVSTGFETGYLIALIVSAVAVGVALIVLAFTIVRKKIGVMKSLLEELENKVKEMRDEATRQMAPLNELFSWDMPTKLIEKTVPNIHFDPYFNAARLKQLCKEFGYTGFLNNDSSVLFAHSGEIKGNPFVIATVKKFSMGMKTYTGYKTIFWTEYERDDKGNSYPVTRSETLTACVTKPCPEYGNRTFIMYANEAAPNLRFTRTPEGLDGDSMITGIRKSIKKRNLEKFSRKLDDDSDYTMMSNQEFEVMFNTKDRNNEVEFRLLFTPLAQSNILKLMRDRSIGYGDDFSVVKEKMINVVFPQHLQVFNIDTDPQQFKGICLEKVRQNFISTNEDYFRQIYFAFAPLLAIPLYQQTRTRKEIYGAKLLQNSSFWEWESLANYQGDARFAHPDSITENILKTSELSDNDKGEKNIVVTANGFSGTPLVDYVSVYGGDGRFHNVPVEWTRYDPVSRDSTVTIREMPDKDKEVIREDSYPVSRFRRRILISDFR